MATVVQAVCPKCDKQLRIPADWLNKSMRCKHCGQVIKARQVDQKVPAAQPPARKASAKNRPAGYKQPPPVPAAQNAGFDDSIAAVPSAPDGQDPFGEIAAIRDLPVSSPRRRPKTTNNLMVPLIVAGGVLFVGIVIGGIVLLSNSNDSNKSVETARDKHSEPDPNPIVVAPNPTDVVFPRRALIVSVHNYLFANVVPSGPPGPPPNANIGNFYRVLLSKGEDPTPGGKSPSNQAPKQPLTQGLKIPANQLLHLSDALPKGKDRTPVKPVIEETITTFLNESRRQDRILLFFIGHGVEIDGEAYLVPMEGELDKAATLIPLKWVYAQLEKCKARQKVLVVDVGRYSPTEGRERPDGGPMSPKFEEALKNPPTGVQVWSACSAGQQSYATDYSPMGLFLDQISETIASTKPGMSLQGTIQKINDPFPLEQLNDIVNKRMAADLKEFKLPAQVCRLYGKEVDTGETYDPGTGQAKPPELPPPSTLVVNQKSLEAVKSVLDEIGSPPVKVSRYDNGLRLDVLPPFPDGALAKYASTPASADSKLRPAIMKARAVLWAVAADSAELKGSLAEEVKKIKADVKVSLTVMREGYRAPAAEGPFKELVKTDELNVAKILGALTEALEELKNAGEDREKESKRWQANYDFMVARLEEQVAYLVEYQSLLGSMRKELPERNPNLHGGWRLSAQPTLSGLDREARKTFDSSRKLLDKLMKEHAGTPWEILAKREKLTNLGLKWEPTK
jgi:Caspase domain